VIEAAGIPTVSITLLREITERVAPPRALFVDRPLGFPLGRAHDEPLQRRILVSALEMLSVEISGPLLIVFADDSADAA
jgi:D-proline reductase (dithiol) PrdB